MAPAPPYASRFQATWLEWFLEPNGGGALVPWSVAVHAAGMHTSHCMMQVDPATGAITRMGRVNTMDPDAGAPTLHECVLEELVGSLPKSWFGLSKGERGACCMTHSLRQR